MPISARKRVHVPDFVRCARFRPGAAEGQSGRKPGVAPCRLARHARVYPESQCHACPPPRVALWQQSRVWRGRHSASLALVAMGRASGHRRCSAATTADAAQVCLRASAGDRCPALRTTPAGGRRPGRRGPGQRTPAGASGPCALPEGPLLRWWACGVLHRLPGDLEHASRAEP